jgi:ammonium transporter, Amt family
MPSPCLDLPLQIFDGVCWVFLKLRIDDPLSAAPMHGFGGMWGVFFTGLLAKEEYIAEAYGRSEHYGAFYPGSTGKLLGAQVGLTGPACHVSA